MSLNALEDCLVSNNSSANTLKKSLVLTLYDFLPITIFTFLKALILSKMSKLRV